MKEKTIYIGIGLLVGVGIGLLSFSKIKITNIGNIDKFTVIHLNEGNNNQVKNQGSKFVSASEG